MARAFSHSGPLKHDFNLYFWGFLHATFGYKAVFCRRLIGMVNVEDLLVLKGGGFLALANECLWERKESPSSYSMFEKCLPRGVFCHIPLCYWYR